MSLTVDAIDVFYGPVQALRKVSLAVGERERIALLGANGAGKTTTLRTLSGLMTPRAGTVTFEGERIDGLPAWDVVARGVAHLPEGRDLFRELSVLENLRMGYWTRRVDRRGLQHQLDVVINQFPILGERSSQAAGTLSGGEQQMLGVARALMSAPRLLIIDELSLGLAPQVVERIFAILEDINKEGTAVLLVEQFVHMALQHTDRAYVLAKGEVVLEGRSSDLLEDPALIASYLGGTDDHAVAQNGVKRRNGRSSTAKVRAARRAPGRAKR